MTDSQSLLIFDDFDCFDKCFSGILFLSVGLSDVFLTVKTG